MFDGDPEDACDVGGGKDAFGFEEFGVALGAGEVGDDAGGAALVFELHHGEHLAADGFVADPEDEAAELLGLDDVGEAEEIGLEALDVHGRSIERLQAALWRGLGLPCFWSLLAAAARVPETAELVSGGYVVAGWWIEERGRERWWAL